MIFRKRNKISYRYPIPRELCISGSKNISLRSPLHGLCERDQRHARTTVGVDDLGLPALVHLVILGERHDDETRVGRPGRLVYPFEGVGEQDGGWNR